MKEEETTNIKTKERVKDTIPQQIHISYLSEVTLGPKQVAIIPMTFLPRFPESSSSEPSAAVENAQRNNLAYKSNTDEYHVRTTMELDTSRGLLRLPIDASSVRKNYYRLPDVIHFQPGGEPSDSPTIGDGNASKVNDDCYDVHLSNPSQGKGLRIFDVVLSRPDLLKMYVRDKETSDAALTEAFKNWEGGVQRSIAPGVRNEYVITICTRKSGESAPEEMLKRKGGPSRAIDLNDGLGYLQIRTDANVLIVNLEQTVQGRVKADAPDVTPNVGQTGTNVLFTETGKDEPPVISSQNVMDTGTPDQVPPPENLTISVTEAPHIEIQLVPYVSPSFVKTIELRNTSPYPIKVMRTTLKMDVIDDPFLLEAANDVGLTVDAKIGKRNMANISSDPHLMDETVILTCIVQSSSSRVHSDKPLRFTGTIQVAASADTDISYNEWSESVKKNPQKDAQLSMVFPFAINVRHRQVHLVLDSSPSDVPSSWRHETVISGGVKSLTGLFYPISRSEGRHQDSGSESFAEPFNEEISYRLGIVSPVGRPLSVAKMEVVEANVEREKQNANNLCRRFTISSFNTLPTPVRVGNSSLFNLGKATLKYSFGRVADTQRKAILYEGKVGMAIDDGAIIPETCQLQILADSADGGKMSIPLILFSGKLDVTSSEYELPLQGKDRYENTNTAPSIITGFDEIVNRLRSSAMGSALKKVLKSLFDSRTSDYKAMLAAYIAGLSTESLSTDHSLWPILVNVGSVVHSEVQTIPLYLANHNPVPVEVSTDVSEVEGMSITLARKCSHGKGDGNGLLDLLPKEGDVKSEKVLKGRWKGHPKRGLQNFLLISSVFPQAIASNLQYRDDISLSPAAAEIQPILRTLYKEKDVGYFHAESVSRDLHSSEASRCPGLDLNPPGYSEEPSCLNDTYPMIMSDSLSMSRRLSVCRDRRNSDNLLERNVASRVLIPPGGVARFEVKLRCPSRQVLIADITHFLATGLVLSTDYGQVMPIIVNFEALLGHLQISTVPSSEVTVIPPKGSYDETIIDVSPGLFFSHDTNGLADNAFQPKSMETVRLASLNESVAQGKNARVPLFITSTFTREVALSKVGSCNPWFDVRLFEHGMKNETPKVDAGETREIGTVQSTIPCRPFQYSGGSDEFRLDLPGELPQFPSFYECALEWLQNRFKLQPRGCGLARTTLEGNADGKNTEEEVLTLATDALKKVVHYSLIRFNDGVPRRHKRSSSSGDDSDVDKEQERPASNTTELRENQVATIDKDVNVVPSLSSSKMTRQEGSYVPRAAVDLFAQLNNAWRLVTESGLNVLSAHLRAQIDYSNGTCTNLTQHGNTALDRKTSQTLSVEMREVIIRTSLKIPTLVDHSRSEESFIRKTDGSELSMLQFPPTRIADVTSLTIPLRNPTPVPIRVRLAAFTKSHQESVDDKYDDIGLNFVSSDVRDRYLNPYNPVYVQNENIKDQPRRGDAQHWWEGGGAFFLPDDRGDIIQARYNLSITAGPGAHISLVNPSLHSFNGLSMGCGTRCGVREESGQGTNGLVEQSSQPRMKYYSPIGASSASGRTLLGHPRPEKSPLNPGDLVIAAGGSTPADPAHLAFAIPYSSLDEIVLPPYGTGELGPILFRPPGRHSILGCGAAVENQGNRADGTIPRECKSNTFESLVFLENSLTGLERLVVRGQGTWESVVFLDPAPSKASPFGDLEYRFGRSTLVFPGSTVCDSSRRTSAVGPVRKEVVVHNDGDIPVDFGRVYFSQAPDLRLNSPVLPRSLEWSGRRKEKTQRAETDNVSFSCQMRGFRLLGCSESEYYEIELNGDRMINLRHGFALNPGQNLSLFVEHYPDCAFNSEYVSLNLEYHEGKGNRTSWSTGPSRSRHGTAPRKGRNLQARKLELLVGFEMSADEIASCVSVSLADRENKGDKHQPLSSSPGLNATESKEMQNFFNGWLVFSAARIVLLCSFLSLAVCVVKQPLLRDTACLFFQSNLRGVNVNGITSKDVPPSQVESDWSAAFRCLARADPLSSELQAVGREQARQLVLDRYKSMGVMMPQCISSAGVLLRDRAGVVGAGGRGGGVISGSEKRAMTLSDAIFRGAFTDQNTISDIDQLLPCSLGWRAAGTNGLVRKPSHGLKSKELLAQRNASMLAAHESGSEEAKKGERREYAETRTHRIPDEVVSETNKVDEHKGDVISTSESEGTTGALREAEGVMDEDLSGFAKVSLQKGRSPSHDKNRKKQAEGDSPSASSERRDAKIQKQEANDASDVPSSKTRVESRSKQQQVTPQAQAQRDKGVANDVPMQQNRVQVQKNMAAAKKDIIAKAKSKKAKNKHAAGSQSILPPPIDGRTIGLVSSPVTMRSMSSTCSSVQSSPSSVGQVSISSRSTTRSDERMYLREQPDYGKRIGMRPPPGLAPPPGFGSSGDGSEHRRVSSHDSLPPVVPNLMIQTEPPLSLGSGTGFTSPVGTPISSSGKEHTMGASLFASVRPPVASSSLLLSNQTPLMSADTQDSQISNGFDVMDFLDSILRDQEPLRKEEESLGDLLAEKATASIAAMPVSSDPWATERKSRAAAYGIHVEDEDDGADDTTDDIVYAMFASAVSTNQTSGESSSSLHNSVPLLTPSAMLAANRVDSEDGEENSSAPLFNRGSFYSSLLKEQ